MKDYSYLEFVQTLNRIKCYADCIIMSSVNCSGGRRAQSGGLTAEGWWLAAGGWQLVFVENC
jgi:cystathionine beta-lyase family protein involved in aluminum resistance